MNAGLLVGGDGAKVKEDIDADYKKGIVRYKNVQVGKYVNGTMELKGEGAGDIGTRFNKLME